jgi:hypothetical protein
MTSHSSTPLIKGETSGIARSLSRAILVVAALGAAADAVLLLTIGDSVPSVFVRPYGHARISG